MSTARDIIHGFAVAAQALANGAHDPRVSIPARGAATILNMAAKLLEKRSTAEVAAVLKRILDEGAQPITESELEEQTQKVLAELAADETAR